MHILFMWVYSMQGHYMTYLLVHSCQAFISSTWPDLFLSRSPMTFMTKSNGQFSVLILILPAATWTRSATPSFLETLLFSVCVLHIIYGCSFSTSKILQCPRMLSLDGFSALDTLISLNNPIQTYGLNAHLYANDFHALVFQDGPFPELQVCLSAHQHFL